MKKEDIKRHLNTYSIYNKRRTTINHAFASAIAPSDNYDEKKISEALEFGVHYILSLGNKSIGLVV
jgi:hypothetical protein